jgi:hypothetical protein
MTMTLPLRRMTLHLSQIFLTLGLTFIIFFLVAVFVLLGWVTYGFPLSFAQTAVTFRQPSLREMLFTIYL